MYVDLFRELGNAGVRYLVTGDLATTLYGGGRLTRIVELVLAPDDECRRRYEVVMGDDTRSRDPAGPIVEILSHLPNDFEDAFARRVVVNVEGQHISFVSVSDLIALKDGKGS